MSKQCNHMLPNGFHCGSFAFNLKREGIEQGNLCDVHYWEQKYKDHIADASKMVEE